ncbi:MAG TPA: CYTH domain-containing protein [Candidatus Limnocylindrales bacterium]|nr:CYTH domain-containing protein [Candidatus Limnocylindrales bacterium]
MGNEIERKFLVDDASVLDGLTGLPYRQGYLLNEASRTVRIRRAGDRGFLTIKGATSGATRPEFEYEIPAADADQLLAMCGNLVIEKVRYRIPIADVVFEIDRFEGANEGLLIAEVELASEEAAFPRPDWLGQEVTDDPRYLNARLSVEPYGLWGGGGRG